MVGEILNLENIVAEKVRALCAKNPAYESMMREVIKADQICENPGFQYKDLQLVQGGHLNVMVQAGLIFKNYESNNYTHWRLAVPREELESVLDDIELARLEEEKKKLQSEHTNELKTVVDPEMIKKFEELIASGTDMLEYLYPKLNPHVIGMVKERKACLISIASSKDKNGIRRRSHVLLWGPPGTAKSAIRDWIKHNLNAVAVGPASSEAGLKGDARADTPGALSMAHDGVIVIEELDKFSRPDLYKFYEALTSGFYEINKGELRKTYQAEVRAIAVANSKELPEQLLDRFDMIYEVIIPDSAVEKKITDNLYDYWVKPKEDYRGEELRQYLMWIKDYEPPISDEVLYKCKQIKNCYIDLADDKRPNIRQKEGLMRVAFSIAKLNHRPLRASDFVQAVSLVDVKFNEGRIQALEAIANADFPKV
jgi:DNA replicative helicase MCM subunit Mcm2 (Cdc46/Mcm family)